jgi:hypothetical protein
VFAEQNVAAVASAEPVVAEQQAPAAPAAEPVVVPVAAVSVFNDSYAATVNCLVFSAAGVAVSVTARGDGSLGPLLHVEASTLVVTPASGAQILDGNRTLQRLASRHCVSKSAVAVVKQHVSDDGNTCCAVLQFDPGCVKRGDSVAFQYGEEFGNYAPAPICCIDDAFIAANTGIEAFLV